MTIHQLAWNATTRVVTVQIKGDVLTAGSTKLPDFIHDAPGDVLGSTSNHVLYHHVRDALYVLGELNMQTISILIDGDYIPLVALTSSPGTVTLIAGATQQITNVFSPANASNQAVVYTTTDAAKATVSATGLITAVATGSAVIGVTSNDGGLFQNVTVTIS